MRIWIPSQPLRPNSWIADCPRSSSRLVKPQKRSTSGLPKTLRRTRGTFSWWRLADRRCWPPATSQTGRSSWWGTSELGRGDNGGRPGRARTAPALTQPASADRHEVAVTVRARIYSWRWRISGVPQPSVFAITRLWQLTTFTPVPGLSCNSPRATRQSNRYENCALPPGWGLSAAGFNNTPLPLRQLRSSDIPTLVIQQTSTRFGDRCFLCAAARIWNRLPPSGVARNLREGLRNCVLFSIYASISWFKH